MANYEARHIDATGSDRQKLDAFEIVGISNEVVWERIPFPNGLRDDWHDVPYTQKFATKVIKKNYAVTSQHLYSCRLKITPKAGSPLKIYTIDGVAHDYYETAFLLNPVLLLDKCQFCYDVQISQPADFNISFECVRTYYLNFTFSEGVQTIYIKTKRDNNFVAYTEPVALQIEQNDTIRCYAVASEGYNIDAGCGNNPATAKAYVVSSDVNYNPTASESVTLSVRVNEGVDYVAAKRSGAANWSKFYYDYDIEVGKGETYLLYAVAQSGYAIDAGFATSSSSPDTRIINNSVSYAPTATRRQSTYRGKCSAQIFGKILQTLQYTSDGSVTDTITRNDSERPVALDGWGSVWSIKDNYGRVLLQGTRSEQQCGRFYAHFRWLSREGAYKEHVLEIKQHKRTAEALELVTMHRGFSILKAQQYGFSAGIDGLCNYDLWYYSDIITSNEVYVNFTGCDMEYDNDTEALYAEWQRVNVTTDEQIVYTGREDNVLELDVIFANYNM